MSEKINATCSICGNGYHLCLSCKSIMDLNPWKRYCDTAEHYKIFQVIKGYNTKIYTKEEAREKLKTINLSDLDNLRENIRNIINDIMGENEIETPKIVLNNIKTIRKKKVVKTEEIDMSNDSIDATDKLVNEHLE